MKHLFTSLLILCLVVACLTPDQRAALNAGADAKVRSGEWTQERAQAVKDSGFDWSGMGEMLGAMGGAVVMSLFGVRVWRGGVNNRRGVAPGGEHG